MPIVNSEWTIPPQYSQVWESQFLLPYLYSEKNKVYRFCIYSYVYRSQTTKYTS